MTASEGKSFSILVVEDERPLIDAIRSKLEIEGFDPVTAKTVEQAKGYLEDVEIDVVWLDHYLLGSETGLQLVAHMRQDDRHADIPIFVVSNTGSPDKSTTYMKLGATKYYVKADHRLGEIIQDIKSNLLTN